MTIKNLQNFGRRRLASAVMQPEFESDSLLSFVLGKERAWLYAHGEEKVSRQKSDKYKKLIQRRKNKEPFAYLTGQTEFCGLPILVNKNVLIPRPETENLVDIARELIIKNKIKTVVDVGTGSGAIIIAISIVPYPPDRADMVQYYGLDISEKALQVARENAKNFKLKNIKFLKSDLLQKLPKKLKHPVLFIANLPYLSAREIKRPELSYEPKIALAGGKNGLKLILRLINEFKLKARPGDTLILEVGFGHEKTLRKITKGLHYKALKDFNGVSRFVIVGLNK